MTVALSLTCTEAEGKRLVRGSHRRSSGPLDDQTNTRNNGKAGIGGDCRSVSDAWELVRVDMEEVRGSPVGASGSLDILICNNPNPKSSHRRQTNGV